MSEKNETIHLASQQELVITRKFNASKETIWKMFTEAQHLRHWWGPAGMELEVKKLDLRPGGIFHYSMTANGHTMWGIFTYREIEAPNRLVFTNSFSNPEGTIGPDPFFGGKWPKEILNELTLAETAGSTTLTLRGKPINASAEEMQLFYSHFDSMNQGFKGTFDQLEKYLQTF